MKSVIKILFVILSYAISSCDNVDKPIDILFNDIDARLSEADKEILDSCQTLQCVLQFIRGGHAEKVRGLLDSMNLDIRAELDSNKIDQYEYLCLFMAYCKDRKGQDYNLKEISNGANSYLSNEIKIWKGAVNNNLKRLQELPRINFKKIQLGDTILLKCPTASYKRATKIYGWASSDDSEQIGFNALVLNKRRTDIDYLLKIRILGLENGICRIDSQSFSISDILTVDIGNYGSEIKID